jgi:uncharacterized membrane protein
MREAARLIARWWHHLIMTRWQLRRCFSERVLDAITTAVQTSEQQHGGEIRVAVEAEWPLSVLWRGLTPRERAVQVFAQLHVWDTTQRNGVLIYISLADRDVEVVADRGLDQLISAQEWQGVCQRLEQAFRQGRYQAAMCDAIHDIGVLMARAYPRADRNEQPDRPVLL